VSTTYNPSDKAATVVLSNGNLTAANSSGAYAGVRGTDTKSSGKWYAEFAIDTVVNLPQFGVADATASLTNFLGSDSHSVGYFSGAIFANGGNVGSGPTFTAGSSRGQLAVDLDNDKIYFGVDNTWANVANPSAGTGGTTCTLATIALAFCAKGGQETMHADAASQTYSPPTGFTAWDSVTSDHGIGTGSLPLTGSGTAKAKVQAIASGTLPLTGLDTGKVKDQSAGAGSLSFTGSASGTVKAKGSASGLLPLSGSVSSKVKAQGSAAGSLPLSGIATERGSASVHGAGAGALSFAGSGGGRIAIKVAANGNLPISGSARGGSPAAFPPGDVNPRRIGAVARQTASAAVQPAGRVGKVTRAAA
jgi:hypothetical protein